MSGRDRSNRWPILDWQLDQLDDCRWGFKPTVIWNPPLNLKSCTRGVPNVFGLKTRASSWNFNWPMHEVVCLPFFDPSHKRQAIQNGCRIFSGKVPEKDPAAICTDLTFAAGVGKFGYVTAFKSGCSRTDSRRVKKSLHQNIRQPNQSVRSQNRQIIRTNNLIGFPANAFRAKTSNCQISTMIVPVPLPLQSNARTHYKSMKRAVKLCHRRRSVGRHGYHPSPPAAWAASVENLSKNGPFA